MITEQVAAKILNEVSASPLSARGLREYAMERLSALESYDWSGVYRLDQDGLILDAYIGETTDHVRIPVGRGVCGTAVAENKNQIVADVRDLDNYLACSLHTRSEIVVLIRDPKSDEILGQIDIDGHKVGAFDASDEAFLGEIARILAARWDP